ncbi:Cyclic nucleotide-binding domain (CNMP-BD) protein [Marinobacterium lacunae]|uniref:diguanylate cyclase n=1 Tax=Marinobacterium lacunae TaxID=1232683 RepID=A0A081FW67_9GAMM|nr:GGDEF domain-containing protein [Marinobacterium lacunae]KEA62772.1 Cyclic nucleotide-binding domain (CNMP-BD) protein [Marinobacterium lacunae]
MKYNETPNQAADFLRQAVPLMVRNRIPPNPLNYALWYAYVSNKVPELNTALDSTLKTYGTCPNLLSEQLFRQHLVDDESKDSQEIHNGLVNLVNTLHEQTSAACEQTDSYSAALRESLEALSELNETEADPLPLESIIRTLSLKTEAINDATRLFQQQIDSAQSEIAALRQELQQTRQDASLDVLTGLFNRRVFDTELEQLVQLGDQQNLCLIMLDVDHFKRFNDTYGHLMGDKVLQYVGRLLKEECTEPLIPVRFGGEEFAILGPGFSIEQAVDVAERLRKRVEAIRIRQKSSGSVISSITASFGTASFTAGDSSASLIERADKALYQAKQDGRNRVSSGS